MIKQIETISINIGGWYAGKGPAIVQTLLGSCVAVCLFDPVGKIGGMNHIMLPGEADIGACDAVSRYAVNAMELLINAIIKLGGNRLGLKAKAFGGSQVLPSISGENTIGMRNTDFVLRFLELEEIPLLGRDLGGQDTRRVYFRTDTGEVLLKRIAFKSRSPICGRELKLQNNIHEKIEKFGNVTIFA
jgi:chemotaxis protein CheD